MTDEKSGLFAAIIEPPPGSLYVSDWEGKRVRTLVAIRSLEGEIPAGRICTVRVGAILGVGLEDKCECCGRSTLITFVPTTSFELVQGDH